MVKQDEIEVRVQAMRHEADAVLSLELARPDAEDLPEYQAGAHIDLHLPNGLVRSYSLVDDPDEARRAYRVGIYRDPATRGGSKYVHEVLGTGQSLRISHPRNNFLLAEDASNTIFLAGGIGVTPFLAMTARLNRLRRRWTVYYGARSSKAAAFLDELQALAHSGGNSLVTHFDDEQDERFLDVAGIIANAPNDTHFYCCGPGPMLETFRSSCSGLAGERVHFEYFSLPGTEAARTGGYTVVLSRSERRFIVPEGNSILDVLLAEGLDLPFSCQEGICGACETRVLSGTPDHRDLLLSDKEKAEGGTMMICCSGSLSQELELDI